jgi:Glyoxalase-like domain
MKLQVDHVTLGASRLEALAGAFAANGLAADYGGLHSNGVTHMSQVGFDDGSYVELVSVLRPGQPSPWWQEHIVHEGGPCAWAVRVTDVDAEVQRLRARGVTVGDTTHMQIGPTPCAFLLGSRDLDASRERCRLGEVQILGRCVRRPVRR